MRQFINILTEADFPVAPPVKTKTKSTYDLMPDLQSNPPAPLPGKTASVAKTRRAGIRPPAAMAQGLANLAATHSDEISDTEAAARRGLVDEPPTAQNLPAVINQALMQDEHIRPEWHQVKQLPGYMQSAIRGVARDLFRQFTDTPIEDLQIITSVAGLNPERDVRGTMAWIKENGILDDSAHIDFSRFMPGYTADAHLWRTEDYSFLLVKDMGGYYVYGWAGGRGVRVDSPDRKMLD